MVRFARFRHHYNFCKLSQERVVGEVENTVVENGKEDDSRRRYFLEHVP